MKINKTFIAISIFVIVFGGIVVSNLLNLWSTEASKEPAMYADGDVKGTYNPDDIRGSYTFERVADLFSIDEEVLLEAFGLPEDTDLSIFKTKNLEEMYESYQYEIGNGSVKVFVALYNNLPIELGDDYLLTEAVDLILEHNEMLTEEQKEYLENHKVDAVSSSHPIESEEKNIVNGNTTFKEVLNMDITEEQIEEIINSSMPPTNQSVRDYCTQNGLPFSVIKNALNSLMD